MKLLKGYYMVDSILFVEMIKKMKLLNINKRGGVIRYGVYYGKEYEYKCR